MPAGPCMLCGARNYSNSMGGRHFCPSCDCGNPPHVGNPLLAAAPMMFPPPTMGCICPGDATPYCRNPLCPRKNSSSS